MPHPFVHLSHRVRSKRSKPHTKRKTTEGTNPYPEAINQLGKKGIAYVKSLLHHRIHLNLAPTSNSTLIVTATARHDTACRAVAEIPVMPRASGVSTATAPFRTLRRTTAASTRALLSLVSANLRIATPVLCCCTLSSAGDERVLEADLLGAALGLC